jgi:hypothetical protein
MLLLEVFIMPAIKSIKSIRDKWTRVTPQRSEDYKLGVANPRRDWATATAAASENYKAGVDKAQTLQSFKKGVEKAGSGKWQKKALAVGPGRFAEGVFQAGDAYEAGFKPFRDAIEKTDLGPRFPRRDPRNLDRVKNIVNALVTAKTQVG